jgi:hypothetical protein
MAAAVFVLQKLYVAMSKEELAGEIKHRGLQAPVTDQVDRALERGPRGPYLCREICRDLLLGEGVTD